MRLFWNGLVVALIINTSVLLMPWRVKRMVLLEFGRVVVVVVVHDEYYFGGEVMKGG